MPEACSRSFYSKNEQFRKRMAVFELAEEGWLQKMYFSFEIVDLFE